MTVSSNSTSHSLPCSEGVFAPVPLRLDVALPLSFFFARPFCARGGAAAGATDTTRVVSACSKGSPGVSYMCRSASELTLAGEEPDDALARKLGRVEVDALVVPWRGRLWEWGLESVGHVRRVMEWKGKRLLEGDSAQASGTGGWPTSAINGPVVELAGALRHPRICAACGAACAVCRVASVLQLAIKAGSSSRTSLGAALFWQATFGPYWSTSTPDMSLT